MNEIFDLHTGNAPVLIAMPHVGIGLPEELLHRLTPEAQLLRDTDWHVDALYGAARELGCSILRARYSRYVVDLNRAPDDSPMYAGRPNTGLVPTLSFDGEPLYLEGRQPDTAEHRTRLELYWRPYHEALSEELARIRAEHGRAVLWDAHSIRSRVPRLFDGVLPDLNFGTNDGASCAPTLSEAIVKAAQSIQTYSVVLNGRFKGGYTTRHYGRPAAQIHAIQLELTQKLYLKKEESPFELSPAGTAKLGASIGGFLRIANNWRPSWPPLD
jgi:N-formylglutamate amidohydrolase